jgi:hypothetical protein
MRTQEITQKRIQEKAFDFIQKDILLAKVKVDNILKTFEDWKKYVLEGVGKRELEE